MYMENGVQYFNGIGANLSDTRFGKDDLLVVSDWDATIARERDVHHLEEVVYPLFHKANGLFDIKTVREAIKVSFDLLFTPIATYHAMSLAGQAPCERGEIIEKLIKPFLEVYQAVESSVRAHDGAFEAISQLRKEYPNSYFVIVTQCPWYLGIGRAASTGMVGLFDGIVGIRQERPDVLLQYEVELNFVDQWVAEQLEKIDLSHFKVIAGVPDNLVKPNPLHAEVALGSTPGPNNVVVCLDDKPRRMGPIPSQFTGICPAFYIQAQVSDWEKAKTETVHGVYETMHELPSVLSKVLARACAAA